MISVRLKVSEGKMITLENFSPSNRDRRIGNSLYRICNTEPQNGKGKWYIHEIYNDGYSLCFARDKLASDDLQNVIDKINSFTEEGVITSVVFGY